VLPESYQGDSRGVKSCRNASVVAENGMMRRFERLMVVQLVVADNGNLALGTIRARSHRTSCTCGYESEYEDQAPISGPVVS